MESCSSRLNWYFKHALSSFPVAVQDWLPQWHGLGSSPVPSFHPLASFLQIAYIPYLKYQVTYKSCIFFTSAVDCGTLTNPANGKVSYTGRTTYGQTATYSCNTGYNLVGSSTHTCLATGMWSGSEPTCQGKLLKHEYNVLSETIPQKALGYECFA